MNNLLCYSHEQTSVGILYILFVLKVSIRCPLAKQTLCMVQDALYRAQPAKCLGSPSLLTLLQENPGLAWFPQSGGILRIFV